MVFGVARFRTTLFSTARNSASGRADSRALAMAAAVQRLEVAGVGDVADGVLAFDDLQVQRHVALAFAKNNCLFRLVVQLLQKR